MHPQKCRRNQDGGVQTDLAFGIVVGVMTPEIQSVLLPPQRQFLLNIQMITYPVKHTFPYTDTVTIPTQIMRCCVCFSKLGEPQFPDQKTKHRSAPQIPPIRDAFLHSVLNKHYTMVTMSYVKLLIRNNWSSPNSRILRA